jgi:hypothetical protein
MPKWLRNLIFSAIRAYSFLRRNFYRVMEQLASMLARATVPGGTDPTGGLNPEASASAAPLLSGNAGDTPDREVCSFYSS